MNQSSKILVTGGTGYIGSHTVVQLLKEGYEVIVLDNFSNSNPQVIDQIKKICGKRPQFIRIDLRGRKSVRDFIDSHPDISNIIHFAAFKSVSESVKNPLSYYDNNISSLINLLTAFQSRELNLVFSSSCTVYGEPDLLPVTENASVKTATTVYAETIQMSEQILLQCALASKNIHVAALRYSNPAGAHHSGLIGELPNGTAHQLVPSVMQTAIGKRDALTVFGNQYDTPDGSCIRDFIHVEDLAKAHIAAITFLDAAYPKIAFEAFNIGTGRGYSVLEVIKTFEQLTGEKVNYRIGENRPGDIVKLWGDTSKANQQLGWHAALGLDEMLTSAWAWEKYLSDHPFSN
jgi:UDP-glucose 4-epimerase